MASSAASCFEYDDLTALTTFHLHDVTTDDEGDEGVLSKFLSKIRTTVSGQQPLGPTRSDLSTSSSLPLHDAIPASLDFDSGETNSVPDMPAITATSPPSACTANVPLVRHAPMPAEPQPSDGALEGYPLTKTSSNDSDTQSVMTTFSVSNTNSLSRIIAKLRGEAYNKEYWMSDEHCKECFECNARFSFFRRKHHCRICGRIYCGKCTSHIIQGERINQIGQLRICNYCFSKLEAQEQEDVASIHDNYLYATQRPSIDIESVAGLSPVLPDRKPLSTTPRMQIPATALQCQQDPYGCNNSKTFAVEIAPPHYSVERPQEHPPPCLPCEPQNDTGLKKLLLATNTLLRPRSRTNTMNSMAVDTSESKQNGSPMPFRRMSAAFSGGFADAGGGTLLYSCEPDDDDDDAPKWDKNPRNLLNFLGGSSIGFPQLFDEPPMTKSDHASSDEDAYETKYRLKHASDPRKHSLKRHMGITGGAVRAVRVRTKSLMRNIPITTSNLVDIDTDYIASPVTDLVAHAVKEQDHGRSTRPFVPRHRRVSSAVVSVELNASSLKHVRTIVRNMLNEVPGLESDLQTWEDVLMGLLLKVSDNVHPDIRSGDEIDIRHYVKIKKIAGGRPQDSLYIKGVVCSKNVARKQMVRTITNPQILILLFPLEWSRGSSRKEHQLQSIAPILAQEHDFLKKLVNRIVALKPSVVLVSSNVSQLALDFLLKANIVVSYNVKPSVLDAVARCTGASIIPSFLQLNKEGLTLGHCGIFETRTLVHEWIPNRRKSFLLFHECPPELGATIILRGGQVSALCDVKRILDFAVFVVHSLKLESFLFKDFAKMRYMAHLLHPQRDDTHRAILTDTHALACVETSDTSSEKSADVETENGCLGLIDDMIFKYQHAILSTSPMVKFPVPYLLFRVKETQKNMVKLIEKRLPALADTRPEPVQLPVMPVSLSAIPNYFRDCDSFMLRDGEYDQLLEEHQQRWRALEACIGDTAERLSPSYHQQIIVLYTCVCTVTTVPCQGPEIRMFEYYRPDSDLTLGQYIEDIVADAQLICPSNMCERAMLQHYRSYAHGNGRINVEIERFECDQPDFKTNNVLMWSYCKHCCRQTSLVPMSENSWRYSFGKFLELMFYQMEDHQPRKGICPHNLFRDHVHYFGFQSLAVRLQHETIEPFEVHVPPMHHVHSKSQAGEKDAALASSRAKITRFYDSVVERNKSFTFDIVQPDMVDVCKEHLRELSRRATGEKKQMLQCLQSVYATSEPTDVLSLNVVRIQLHMSVVQWDVEYANFVRSYVRPERELRRLTTSHLKKMLPRESLMFAAPVSSLNLRTKRAIEAVDLPLLDIGIDGSQNDPLGASSVLAPSAGTDGFSTALRCVPILGESPTSASPWLEEEERLNSLLRNMQDKQWVRAPSDPEKKETRTTQNTQHEGNAQELDPRVARRLSLELMKDSPKNSVMAWSSDNDPPVKERKTTRKSRTELQPNTALEHSSSVLPLLSSNARKILSELLPISISKSHSSPPPTSSNLPNSRIPEPSWMLHGKKRVPKETPTKRHKREKSESSTVSTAKRGPSQENAGKRELRLTGYRYGYKGSAERGSSANLLRRIPPLPDVASDVKESKVILPHGRPSTGPSICPPGKSVRFPKVMQNARTNSSNHQARLPSKSSIEVFTTIRDLVREESDDEFATIDMDDDETDNEDEYGDDQDRFGMHRAFSLTRTDEYDDSLGRDMIPLIPQLRRLHREQLPFFNSSLPHLSIDSENDMPKNVHANHRSVPDFRNEHHLSLPSMEDMIPRQVISSLVGLATTVDSAALALSTSGPERSSFMRAIASMLAEKGMGNLLPLEYPLSPLSHVFPGSLVIVGEDEPSTIVAHALSCDDYIQTLRAIREGYEDGQTDEVSLSEESEKTGQDPSLATHGMFIERTLRSKSGIHMKYFFTDGTTKFFCKIFFAEQFDALRRNCGCDKSYVASLASCRKWDSSGGKSGSVFLKTMDDRFLIKQISKYEMDAFLRFAPSYFQYLSEAFFHELPTVLSKIFGMYSIGFRNTTTGRSMRMDILVMENLFYQRVVKKIFDLKGSMRNRHVQATGKENEVLLDENMVELMYQSPLFLRSHSKEMLRGSLHNDTLFLSRLDVMDYSLLVGVDEKNQELVVGIVDFIRTFTWDKKLESWVKESGILGGGGKEPTIISPRQYRIRFREAMDRYFLTVPDFWSSRFMRNPEHGHAVTGAADTERPA